MEDYIGHCMTSV